jgi:hypothetical protein
MQIENIFNINEQKKKDILPTGSKLLLESVSNINNLYAFLIKKLGDKELNIDNSKIDNSNNTEHIKKYILLKLFLSDDFIEILLIFEYFIDNIELNMKNIQNWCFDNGLEYTQLRTALFLRNSIINTLYELNINPFHNESLKIRKLIICFNDNHFDHTFNTLKSIKKAIYGGYFNNLLLLNPETNSYYNNQNIKIKIISSFINIKTLSIFTKNNKYKPRYIITNSININSVNDSDPIMPAPLLYTIKADKISIMDGFVYPDFEFSSPKKPL